MVRSKKLFLLSASIVLLIDQVAKAAIIMLRPDWTFAFLNISITTNTGAAFGILQGQNLLLIFISLIALALMRYYYRDLPSSALPQAAAGLILGGILGNLADRLLRGHVIDFIGTSFWPSFNVADSAITLGVLGLLWFSWKEKNEEGKNSFGKKTEGKEEMMGNLKPVTKGDGKKKDTLESGDLSKIFGSLPRKMSGQAFKNMVRKGW